VESGRGPVLVAVLHDSSGPILSLRCWPHSIGADEATCYDEGLPVRADPGFR
jgi:hypothetical protein